MAAEQQHCTCTKAQRKLSTPLLRKKVGGHFTKATRQLHKLHQRRRCTWLLTKPQRNIFQASYLPNPIHAWSSESQETAVPKVPMKWISCGGTDECMTVCSPYDPNDLEKSQSPRQSGQIVPVFRNCYS